MKNLESLYVKGDFAGAKEYLLNHRDDFGSGQFNYNLGTLEIKTNDFAVARYHLEKAVSDGYVHPKVFKNLDSAKELLQVKESESEIGTVDTFLLHAKSIPGDAMICLSLLILLVVGVLKRKKKIVNLYTFIASLVVGVLPIIFYFYLQTLTVAIALQEANLREGPSEIYAETLKIPAGHKVILGEKNGNWYFVKSPLKFAGWIDAKEVGLL